VSTVGDFLELKDRDEADADRVVELLEAELEVNAAAVA